jgi:diacylglycerol kinase (ATP)
MERSFARYAGRALVIALGVLPFVVITLLVVGDWAPLLSWDRDVAEAAADYGRTRPGWVDFWEVVGAVVLPWASRAAVVLIAAYLWRRRAHLLAIWLVVSAAAELALVQAVKFLVDRDRPEVQLVVNDTPAYVSGHAAAAFVLAGAIGVVLPSVRGWRLRTWLPVGIGTGLLSVFVAVDRIVLATHYLSDVLGGWALGLAILTATTAGFQLRARRRIGRQEPVAGSEPPRAAVIVNPVKVGDGAAFRRKVSRALESRGFTDTLWLETAEDDAGYAMAKRAVQDEVDLVLVAGGDGTVRVVCAELAHTGIPLGVVPAGTGNLLARNLGIPLDLDDALYRLLDGYDRKIDLVEVHGDALDSSRFAVMAGLGLDAAIMDDVPDDLKKRIGWTAYLFSAFKNINHPSVRVEITLDDDPPLHRRARTVVVGNVGHLQANVPLLPDARPDDGMIDVIVIAPRRVTQWPKLILRVLVRWRRSDPYLERFTAARVEITAADDVRRQLDGDAIGSGRSIVAQVEPGALVVRVP